ncbi:hypothetical protein V865_002240 [Kwoniella europaea PYCC6329]|uniref:Uncharacterized protein n=1 Tax=Kwoniella europaea PYCC6329 TaxID=1423913 RepID=A0AAX4KDS7_9TREE
MSQSNSSASFSQTDRLTLKTLARAMLQGYQEEWVINAVDHVESHMQSQLMDMSDTTTAKSKLRTTCDEIKSSASNAPKGKSAIR